MLVYLIINKLCQSIQLTHKKESMPFAVEMQDPTGHEPVGLRLMALCWSDLQELPIEFSEVEAAAELKRRFKQAIEQELETLEFEVRKLDEDDPYFDEAGKPAFWLFHRLNRKYPAINCQSIKS